MLVFKELFTFFNALFHYDATTVFTSVKIFVCLSYKFLSLYRCFERVSNDDAVLIRECFEKLNKFKSDRLSKL
jgi:hypothetical protein